jgi:hypothetical protein
MARRCVCARLLSAVQEDPRLRTLPLSARMLFLLVAEAATRAPVFGVVPFSETARVSLLVSASETEVETQMETLMREGLIRAGDADGLVVPLLADAPPRSEAARRNGAAGGRPRKGETPEAARARRQREMLLTLPGGLGAETQETQDPKPAGETGSRTTTTYSQVVQSAGSGACAETPAWVSLGEELAELVGMDGARGGYDYRPVQAWLQAGRSAETIRAAITRVVSRPGFRREAVRSFSYFANAVAEQPVSLASPRVETMSREEEDRRMAAIQAQIDARVACRSVAAA